MSEKRKFKRKDTNFVIKFSAEGDDSTIYAGSFSKNISESGICLTTNISIKIGSIINIKFMLPSKNEIFSVKAKIVWAKELLKGNQNQFGVKFLDLDEEIKKELENWCQN